MAGLSLHQLLLGLFFILYGALAITNLQVQAAPVVLGFLALLGGICWLLGR